MSKRLWLESDDATSKFVAWQWRQRAKYFHHCPRREREQPDWVFMSVVEAIVAQSRAFWSNPHRVVPPEWQAMNERRAAERQAAHDEPWKKIELHYELGPVADDATAAACLVASITFDPPKVRQ